MDYTGLFTQAIAQEGQYCFAEVQRKINALSGMHCGDWDDWADNRWYRLCPRTPCAYEKCYGFLCAEYPVALLTEHCPSELTHLLDICGVLYAALQEPMSCNEHILRQYVRSHEVFDEHFLDTEALSPDDTRLLLVLKRLETGEKSYIDASCFTMQEIR